MKSEHSIPESLYKIVSPEDWHLSQLQLQVVNSSMDTNFIHLAKDDQLASISKKFWNEKEFIVLKLDSVKLKGNLIYEINPGGTTKYYHLYGGTIPLDAVVEILQQLP